MSKFKRVNEPKEINSGNFKRLPMDMLSFTAAVSAIVILIYALTQTVAAQDLVLTVSCVLSIIVGFAGLLLRLFYEMGTTNSVQFEFLDTNKLLWTLIGTGVTFIGLVALVYVVPSLSALSFPNKLFYACQAIVETLFFNYFVFAWISTFMPWPVAAAFTAPIFAFFHLGVLTYAYNLGWDWGFLAFAGVAMFFICVMQYAFQNLAIAMGAHTLFNVFSAGASVISFTGAVAMPLSLVVIAPCVGVMAGSCFFMNKRGNSKKELMKNAKVS